MRVLIPLVNGFEEIEAITVIDILRRAEIEVVVAGLDSDTVTGSHRISLLPDTMLDELWSEETQDPASRLADQFQALVLPGGPGTRTLQADPRVTQLVRQFMLHHHWVAAICAAPTILAQHGVLANRTATSFYSPDQYQEALTGQRELGLKVGPIAHYRTDPVVVDGRIITSRGAGTALAFALQLVAELRGLALARGVAESIHADWIPAVSIAQV